jgi:hypothetical protein
MDMDSCVSISMQSIGLPHCQKVDSQGPSRMHATSGGTSAVSTSGALLAPRLPASAAGLPSRAPTIEPAQRMRDAGAAAVALPARVPALEPVPRARDAVAAAMVHTEPLSAQAGAPNQRCCGRGFCRKGTCLTRDTSAQCANDATGSTMRHIMTQQATACSAAIRTGNAEGCNRYQYLQEHIADLGGFAC